jgi:hypothetical protein
MKKALVLFLILAVAGGLFAGGELSKSGSAEIGAKIDLATTGGPFLTIGGDDDYDRVEGTFSLGYTDGGLKIDLAATAKYWEKTFKGADTNITLTATYTADRYGFRVRTSVKDIVSAIGSASTTVVTGTDFTDVTAVTTTTTSYVGALPAALYGYYKFMDGGLKFTVSYKGGSDGIWEATSVVKKDNSSYKWNGGGGFDVLDGFAGIQFTYTGIENLKAGAMFGLGSNSVKTVWNNKFVDMFLLTSSFGLKYDTGDMGFSVQASLRPKTVAHPSLFFNAHAAFYYQITEAIRADADFYGTDFASSADMGMGFGLKVAYKAAPINAHVLAVFKDIKAKQAWAQVDFNFAVSDEFGVGLTVDVTDILGTLGLKLEARADYESGPLAAGIKINTGDLLHAGSMGLSFEPYIEYEINDQFTAGADVGVYLTLGGGGVSFAFNPYLKWAVTAGASMYFDYYLEYDSGVSDHAIRAYFKWSF